MDRKENKSNEELLNFIYQNASMGVNTIEDLVKINEDKDFHRVLTKQKNHYEDFMQKCEKIYEKRNLKPEDISMSIEIQSYLMIKASTITNKSVSHLSEMLMNGSAKGIIQITKRIKQHSNADKEILVLAGDLLQNEDENFNILKRYL